MVNKEFHSNLDYDRYGPFLDKIFRCECAHLVAFESAYSNIITAEVEIVIFNRGSQCSL